MGWRTRVVTVPHKAPWLAGGGYSENSQHRIFSTETHILQDESGRKRHWQGPIWPVRIKSDKEDILYLFFETIRPFLAISSLENGKI